MNGKIKSVFCHIIIGVICFALGGCLTGFSIYKIASVNVDKLKITNQRINDDYKTIEKQFSDSKDTIARLNESITSNAKYIEQLQTAIDRISKISGKSQGTIINNDKLISRLEILNTDITNELDKIRNTK